MFNSRIDVKLLKLMEIGEEYSVSQLWKLLYGESGYYEEYMVFHKSILTKLENYGKIKIDTKQYPYKVRKIRG